jgi:hypothetical protein
MDSHHRDSHPNLSEVVMGKGVVTLVLLACMSASCHADTLARDGNGGFVGFYTGILEHTGVVLVSSKGYRFVINRENGWLRGPDDDASERIYFENGNCTGGAHFQFHTAQYAGVIVALHGGANSSLQVVYYVPQNAVSDSIVDLNSYLDYSGPNGAQTCTPVAPTQGLPNVPLLPNDPAVTGVPNSDFVPPITVTSNSIFKNGFEAVLAQAASSSVFA